MESIELKKLVIIGASGHGKVVADIAVECGYRDIVFLDDNRTIKECAGFPVVGMSDEAYQMINADFIVAIGNATIRKKIQESLTNVVTLIHPSAVVGRKVVIGAGTVVMAGAVINHGTVIGRGCIINTSSSIDHDCRIDDYVHVSVGSHIAGTVTIGEKTWVGAGATVSNNINICDCCMIGAGAVVVNAIQNAGTYVGIPAKRLIDKFKS